MTQYKIGDAIDALDSAFPLSTQDSWDNSGLLIGQRDEPLRGIALCVDVTEGAMDFAIERGCNLIIAHHPLIFRGLKRLTGSTPEQRIAMTALRNGIAIAAFHTPADKSMEGTSGSLGRMLGLTDMRILVPESEELCKIVTYVPLAQSERVRMAMAAAGAGHIGNYSHCSWRAEGMGEYMAEDGAQPFAGQRGKMHNEPEERVEAIAPRKAAWRVEAAIRAAHPYEEAAIDILPILNERTDIGYGIVGNLPNAMSAKEFLDLLKSRTGCACVRHTAWDGEVSRVAICTGSGSEFTEKAIGAGAQAYVTADMKYHQMADASGRVMIADIGHYESESITKVIFKDVLTRKLPNFANYETYRDANPIKYY